MKVWSWISPLAALAVGSLAPSAGYSQTVQTQAKASSPEDVAETAGVPLIGKYAPSITLKTVDGKLIDLAFQIREHHMRARASDKVGVERRRSAHARCGERFGRLLKLAQSRVNILKLCRRVAAASPQARND